MKRTASILFFFVLTMGIRAADHFYVWQQHWSSNVVQAVVAEPTTTLYPLVTVVAPSGKSTMVNIPWKQIEETEHTFIPVIRVPIKAFNRSDIQEELIRICNSLIDFSEIQLDLDCPESRLNEYAKLLSTIRSHIPQQNLSITALPSHLGNQTFKKVASNCDLYVLQVHGLDVPDNMKQRAELMNLKIAEQAIHRAEQLNHPYAIALPSYAYELNFDQDTGKFLHLTAEGPVRKAGTLKRRIAADSGDLTHLVKKFQTLEHADHLIWFRLPVEGDRLCLPRETLAEIQCGNIPDLGISCQIEPIRDSTVEISLFNKNVIHAHEASLSIHWNHPKGAYDLYRHARTPEKKSNRLPRSLTAPVPAPGTHIKLGWFSTKTPPKIKVSLK